MHTSVLITFICLLGIRDISCAPKSDPTTYNISSKPSRLTVFCPFLPTKLIADKTYQLDGKLCRHGKRILTCKVFQVGNMWRLSLSFPHTNFTQLVVLPDHEKFAITMQGEPFSRTRLYQTFSFLDSKPFYHVTDAKKSTRTVRCAIKVPGDPLALKLAVFVDGVIQCSLSLQKADPCGGVVYVPKLEMVYASVTVKNKAGKLGSLHSVICKINGTYGEKYISHYVSFGSNVYIT
nr:unnamed protein product [Spirometra erinaceieuropaei]